MRTLYPLFVFILALSGPLVALPVESTGSHGIPEVSHVGNSIDIVRLLGTSVTLNMGQIPDDRVVLHTQNAYFTPDGVVFRVAGDGGEEGGRAWMHVYMMGFAGANHVVPAGRAPLPQRSNFFLGDDPSKWATDVPNFREVVYEGLYPGIDLVFKAVPEGMKYEFIVSPGADVGDIRIEYVGAVLRSDGTDLLIDTPAGQVRDGGLMAYQDGGTLVEASLSVEGNAVTYDVEYDPQRTLVIDPLIAEDTKQLLNYSTYIGSPLDDWGNAMALDASNNVCIAGATTSPVFPVTVGSYDTSINGTSDAILLKLDPTGTAVLYSTFIGGSSTEVAMAMALDASNNVYMTGYTVSTDFPTTPGANDTSFNGHMDVFVVRLNSTGTSLDYSTYLGGWVEEVGFALAVDPSENTYITGYTTSGSPFNFPTTAGAFNTSYPIGQTVFITKMNTSGAIVYSTFLGGDNSDKGYAVAVDTAGNAYITGYTDSRDFPTTPGAYNTTASMNRKIDTFVTKLDPSGSSLVFSTYLAGNANDFGNSIHLDSLNNVIVAGGTDSSDFPTTVGACNTTHNGVYDAFVTKLNASGTGLIFSTFAGGHDVDVGKSVTLDMDENVYLAGYTQSDDFPVTEGAFDTGYNGSDDVFVMKFSPNASTLIFSTYIAGAMSDQATGVQVDHSKNIFVTGITDSDPFPTTVGAYDTSSNGMKDIFVAKFRFPQPPDRPLNVTAAPGDGNVLLNWSPPEVNGILWVTGYDIYGGDGPDNLTNMGSTDNLTHSRNLTGLVNGMTYHFAVTASNYGGEGMRSAIVNATPGAAPTRPEGLNATAGDAHVRLSWHPPTDKKGFEITNYSIFRGLSGATLALTTSVGNLTEFNDTGLKNGVTYHYAISATNARGEGPLSNTTKATTGKVPSAPTNISVNPTYSRMVLTWSHPTDDGGSAVSGFNLYRGDAPDNLTLVQKVGNVTYLVDFSVQNGRTYHYAMSASNAWGEGPTSGTVSGIPGKVPSAPSANATAGNGYVSLEWTLPDDGGCPLLHYLVFKGEDPGALVVVLNTTNTSHNDTDVVNGRTYHYAVIAVTIKGESPRGPVVSATPLRGNGDPAITSIPPLNATVGEKYSYNVTSADPDGDKIAWALETMPEGMSITDDGIVGWVPADAGDFNVVLTARDSFGGNATQSWIITVTRPLVLSVTIGTPSDGEEVGGIIRIGGSASISEGFIRTVEVKVGGSDWMRANGTLAWFLDFDASGMEDGEYTVLARCSDGTHMSKEASVRISVRNGAGDEDTTPDGGGTGRDLTSEYLWLVMVVVMVVCIISAAIYVKTRKPATSPPMPKETAEGAKTNKDGKT